MSKLDPPTSPNRGPTSGRCFAFGLGCMQFLPTTRTDKLTISQYCSDLDRFLRAIHAITDIEIDPGFEEDAYWTGTAPSLRNGGQLWPGTEMDIRVSLHIPSRIQEEIDEGLSHKIDSEQFSLIIRHCYFSPVAIVAPMSDLEIGGSDSVYLIREYLEQSIQRAGLTSFVLDSIGPSPFHANFSIREQDENNVLDAAVMMDYKVQPGYHSIIWSVDTQRIPFDVAVAKVLDGVRDDADMFYKIAQSRLALLDSWAEASKFAHDVTNLERETSVGSWIKNYAKKGRCMKDAIMSIAEYQMLNIETRADLISTLGQHVWDEESGIKTFCEREFQRLEKFPATELRELLQFLESRARHVDNVMIALLAATLGGLVGGTLGVLAS